MAVIQLVGLLLVLALTRSWARRLPAWLVLFPAWVGTGILIQIAVGAVLMGVFSPPSQASNTDLGGIQPWVYVTVYAAFAGQGTALAIAFACHVRARWRWLLGHRTGEAVATQTDPMRSRPENHLTQMAQAVAGMAVAVALPFCYWAAGGSFGLSDAQTHPPWYLQASRVVGALTAVAGLLALAGRWGHQTRFWLPVTLIWFGSGAMAAFDGLVLVLNKLFLVLGMNASEPGWSLIDTALAIKVVIGVFVAVVGGLAVAAAAKDYQQPAEPDVPGATTAEPPGPRDTAVPLEQRIGA
jgi:hypothetical protein